MRIFWSNKKRKIEQSTLINKYIYKERDFFAKPIIATFEQTNKIKKKENFLQQDR